MNMIFYEKEPKMISPKIPTWPRERDLATYTKYAGIDFENELLDGKTWMDIGCRTGKAMSETKQFCRAVLIGVNAHQIEVREGIKAIFAEIPYDRSVYKKFKKKVDLLTDIYGAFSYNDDPIVVLIYEACLLKNKAKAIIISLEAKFGKRSNQQHLQQFFEEVMGQKVTFKRFRTYSDNSRKQLNSIRITITGDCKVKDSLNSLIAKAYERMGRPKKEKLIYSPPDKSCELWKIVYEKSK